MKLKKYILVLIVAVLVFGFEQAKADQYWSAMQVTCDKNLNYFTLKTVAVDDVLPKEKYKDVDQKSGIFPLENYTCDLPASDSAERMKFPARKITVEITSRFDGIVPKPSPIHQCAIPTDLELNVSVNGVAVGKFDAYPGSCGDNATHFIELDISNAITDCTLVSQTGGDAQSECNKKVYKWY